MYLYAGFVTALDDIINSRPPFDQLDEHLLADIGVDRFGRFVDPNDHRRDQPRAAEQRARDLMTLALGLLQGQ